MPLKIIRRRSITRPSRFVHIMALFGVALLLSGCARSAPETEEQDPASRELVDLGSRIADYSRQAADRAPYTPPTGTRRERLARGVDHLLDGDSDRARKVLASAGFSVTRLTDAASGRRYDEVAARGDGPEARWGRLYVHAEAGVRWSVQVPHPVADRDTETLGARLLEGAPHGALVVAGAHRTSGRGDAADVAHRTDSAFHAIILELQKRDIPGIQLHGFAKGASRPYDAIVSSGAARTASEAAARLADLMDGRDLRVCRGWSARCPLEGTTNVQGRAAERHGSTFLHVELAPTARDGGSKAAPAQAALTGVLAHWSNPRQSVER